MITHIVFFKMAEPRQENAALVKEKLLTMSGKIKELKYIEVGLDVIHSERSYDVALITKFDSLEDLYTYNVCDYHAGEVVPFIKARSVGSAAVDFES